MVLEVGVGKKTPLKTRKLLYLRSARNAKTAKSAYFWHVYGTDNTVVNTKVVYGTGDTAHAKLAESFGSPVPA